jgi:hypothetical protein
LTQRSGTQIIEMIIISLVMCICSKHFSLMKYKKKTWENRARDIYYGLETGQRDRGKYLRQDAIFCKKFALFGDKGLVSMWPGRQG